jgi:uncharacterized membrane protein YqiK
MDILLYVITTSAFFYVAVVIGLLLLMLVLNSITRIFVYIKNDEYGIVEKLWSLSGSVKSGFISLDGAAGYMPEVLRGGPHFFVPFQYRVHKQRLITVRNLAYIFARDGIPLPAGQTLARAPDNMIFEDTRRFLSAGGQRGPQRQIVREGVYAFNTALFVVMTGDQTYALDIGADEQALTDMKELIDNRHGFDPVIIRDDSIGVVTVMDGPVLEHGAIIAAAVGTDRTNQDTFHNSFQDIDRFMNAGGSRGRQEQPLVEGTYFINRLFATVDAHPKTTVVIGTAGVVVSYTGGVGEDVSGTDYKHGTLVLKGQRGVWKDPLPPGKYAFNPYAYSVVHVPTTNFVLRWIEGRHEDHGLDTNLAEIKLITRDAFEPILPLSIVVHISPENAPKLIQQFADVKKLVDQTIDPMVSAYFKDAAQRLTMLDLIQERSKLQEDAKNEMQKRFAPYNIEIMEVLIGTPRAAHGDTRISALLDQIRDRQLAVEQQATYVTQGEAAKEQLNLNKARAAAERQTALTESLIQISVRENEGKAELALKTQAAAAIRVTAEANAYQTVQEGQATATRTSAIGKAEGEAIRAKVEAFTGEGAQYQLQQTIATILGDAIQHSPQALVPEIMILGGEGESKNSGSNSMLQALIAMALTNRDKATMNGSGSSVH